VAVVRRIKPCDRGALARGGLGCNVDLAAIREVKVGPIGKDRVVGFRASGRDNSRLRVRGLSRVARLVARE
jgi:hypothetical protein